MDAESRLWAKVNKKGPYSKRCRSRCWVWTASLKGGGYAQFWFEGKNWRVHRLVYEWLVGPIPKGLDLDHLCRNRACVRPTHLQPVTRKTNLKRGAPNGADMNRKKTHCPQGHKYDKANTIHYKGRRMCRACNNKRGRQRYARSRE